MVFITTGQRIATENFSDGVIYKVTFVNATISYMMCVGIGQDFVMLQGPNPSLFCLTMSSASRVSTIDIHDPTPPEPPTPIENALQYQTGEPPFTFTTTESSLFSWYIEGPCGVKTANLTDINNGTGTQTNDYYADMVLSSANKQKLIDQINGIQGEKWLNFTVDNDSYRPNIYVTYQDYGGVDYRNAPFHFRNNDTVTNIIIRARSDNASLRGTVVNFDNIMLNTGENAMPFAPYGKYEISILSNENAETIYLDEALAEGERLYSVNIDTVVVTDIGENTLSVTPTPPEMQIVYGIYAEA